MSHVKDERRRHYQANDLNTIGQAFGTYQTCVDNY